MPPMIRRRPLLLQLLSTAALAAGTQPRAATAQPLYPARPFRWIVPYPAGAGADIVARTVGAQLAIDTGQPVTIENRAGGNTALGAIEAARAPADGYTLLSADNGMLVFNPAIYRNLSYNPVRDFAPVTLMGRLPMVLLVGSAAAAGLRSGAGRSSAVPTRFERRCSSVGAARPDAVRGTAMPTVHGERPSTCGFSHASSGARSSRSRADSVASSSTSTALRGPRT